MKPFQQLMTALICSWVIAGSGSAESGSAVHPDSVHWSFESELPEEAHGSVRLEPGALLPPVYPDFSPTNQVLLLEAPAWIRIPDPGPQSQYDFDNGDAITLEAWVRIGSMGENVYLVGKGRTETSGARSLNQNWALRLRKSGGRPCLNFLFRSRKSDEHPGAWHRWTSKRGLTSGSQWHHVAVSYRFGDPTSIRGFIDGERVDGKWDLGGATTEPPVVDDDDIWIGSSMAGHRGNSLNGALDNVAIHRSILPDDQLQARFRWQPPPIEPPNIPAGKVVMQLFGPLASHTELPRQTDAPVTEWQQETLAFVRLPQRYDAWGIRDDWGSTMLVRAWTDIDLPPGDYQFLARSRGLSRLLIDDTELLTTPPQRNYSNAHHPVDDLPSVPVRGMRPAAMSDAERVVAFHSDGGTHRIRYDLIVGGPAYRLEFGETCVGIARPGEMFRLLSHRDDYRMTDVGWQSFVDHQTHKIDELDRMTRTAASRVNDAQWAARHDQARQQLIHQQPIDSIDVLIDRHRRRLTQPASASASDNSDSAAASFYENHVVPVFQAHCSRCHEQKEQGGLRVSDRQRLLQGGESGEPAVVPGHPEDSYLFALVSAPADDYRMPPKGSGLSSDEVEILRQWITDGAVMPESAAQVPPESEPIDDLTFLRRVYLDTVGVPPTPEETADYLADSDQQRRQAVIDRLLQDPRWGDNWVGYWQDVLAENPNLLKPTLNNTGPFRYWLHEALTDNRALDRMATELIMMRGSTWGGGAAGFAVASQNDVPMAAKAHVISSAFLGVNLKCARCHDAPYHQWKQSDLFQMAAMLERRPLKLPASSTVPAAFFEQQERQSLIDVTLTPGSTISAEYPFPELDPPQSVPTDDSREMLAAQVTSSRRFAEVIANRIWKRLMGIGLVEPVDDWENNPPSDPELLACLADTLISVNYDLRAFSAEIFRSQAYQSRAVDGPETHRAAFPAHYRRRMSAEQIVDSAFHSLGRRMDTEQLTLDVEGTLPASRFLNFGFPQRAWEFTTLANERDRPSLALPKAQAVVDVLNAFGWRNSRPEPVSEREEAPNLIQPGVLANGTLGLQLTRLTDDSGLTQLMLRELSVAELVDALFLQVLTRHPTPQEQEEFTALLSDGYDSRRVPLDRIPEVTEPVRFRYVSWSNHLSADANVIKMEMQERVRRGPPPTRYLQPEWRERAEDAVWSLLNSPESVLIP